MKKILIAAAATASLVSLAACGEKTATNTTAENVAAAETANAAYYDAAADNTSNSIAEAVLENKEAVAENHADAAAANAH
jgi:predicted small lipoprotein YifL